MVLMKYLTFFLISFGEDQNIGENLREFNKD
jgi:hypothetical protein